MTSDQSDLEEDNQVRQQPWKMSNLLVMQIVNVADFNSPHMYV